jgi:hypothetical protein
MNAVAGASAIEVDLVVSHLGADARRLGQIGWVTATQLQRYGMFLGIEREQPRGIAAEHRARRDHLRI